jgi:uncharacterized protein YgiM (DUF1202 family)
MIRSRVFLLCCVVLLLVSTTWSGLGTMNVQVRDGQLRSTASFLGAVVGAVAYGAAVEVLQQQGEWMEVRDGGGKKGWIHGSALTKKQVALQSGAQSAETKASGKELALAGKGFNADIEAEFKKGHRNLDYTWVDRMERIKVAPQEIVAFLKKGELHSTAGGAR